MAGSIGRSISIGLSANTKNFAKSLRSAERNLERFKNAVKVLGTAVASSFAAMSFAALMFGKSAIAAALEDQKSQVLLAKTIKNNAKARKGLLKDSEATINALESQYNIVDDKLRPAFGKLVIATKSVSKSQKLIRTAIDVSATSGKSLDSVVTALARAYLGSNTALGKLGLGIDKAKLKTMTFDQLLKTLAKTTGGAGKAQAGTYQGAVDGLSIAWQNFQESVGYKILPKLGQLLTYIKTNLMPFLGDVRDGFDGIAKDKNSPAAKLGASIQTMFKAFQNLFASLSGDKAANSLSTLEQMAVALTAIANAITRVTNAVTGAKKWWGKDWRFGINGFRVAPGPDTGGSGGGGGGSFGGTSQSNFITPSVAPNTKSSAMSTGNTTIVLNGIIDAEASRRAIEKLLQQSSLRTGTVKVDRKVIA
jgi:hypothetical protein